MQLQQSASSLGFDDIVVACGRCGSSFIYQTILFISLFFLMLKKSVYSSTFSLLNMVNVS